MEYENPYTNEQFDHSDLGYDPNAIFGFQKVYRYFAGNDAGCGVTALKCTESEFIFNASQNTIKQGTALYGQPGI